jgi:glycosyltransferase involved in cell wall biosynthesis
VTSVHFVVPNDIDDPATPSGGNTYDRRVCDGLRAREHAVTGAWPHPTGHDLAGLGHVLQTLPDQATVVVDGLIASAAPAVLTVHSARLRLIFLMHMPLGTREEQQALRASAAVVTTSKWCRQVLLDEYAESSDRIQVAEPGVDAAPIAPGSAGGSRLLCVAALTPNKGHDVLVDALATMPDLEWNLRCVGSLDRDPAYAEALRKQIQAAGLTDRIVLCGARTRDEVGYADADLVVHASRGETFGMVVAEALACGLPVVATEVGGVPEALGRAPDGSLPGVLVPPDDAPALAAALRTWLEDAATRDRLRTSARARRATLTGWDMTVTRFAEALRRNFSNRP